MDNNALYYITNIKSHSSTNKEKGCGCFCLLMPLKQNLKIELQINNYINNYALVQNKL